MTALRAYTRRRQRETLAITEVLMSRSKKTLALGLVAAGLALGATVAGPASAHDPRAEFIRGSVPLTAELNPLNNSGVTGMAHARVTGGDVITRFALQAQGLTPEGPHAMHIHFGETATHECPTFKEDANGDFRLNTAEGLPRYGPIAVSLTTSGDASPASALALERMPVAKDGQLRYARNGFGFSDVTDVDGKMLSARQVAAAVRGGEGVVVVHGIDYNQDGKYGESRAGMSELKPAVPAEATDPVACGVLMRR